jgi:hypothetical protein
MQEVGPAGWFSLAAAIMAVCTGFLVLDPLPPTVTPLYGIPPLVLGIGLWVSATFGQGMGVYGVVTEWLPDPVHTGVQLLGAVLVTGGTLWLLKQPPAGAGTVVRWTAQVDRFCTGVAPERVDPALFETLDRIESNLAGQSGALQARVDAALPPLLARCRHQAVTRFAHPDGTHRSWRQLRDWMRDHPRWNPASDPLWDMPWRALRHRRKPVPSDVVLTP